MTAVLLFIHIFLLLHRKICTVIIACVYTVVPLYYSWGRWNNNYLRRKNSSCMLWRHNSVFLPGLSSCKYNYLVPSVPKFKWRASQSDISWDLHKKHYWTVFLHCWWCGCYLWLEHHLHIKWQLSTKQHEHNCAYLQLQRNKIRETEAWLWRVTYVQIFKPVRWS